MQVKHTVSRDPRYDAVGSSTLREELFNTFLKARGSVASSETNNPTGNQETGTDNVKPIADADKERERQQRRERAVKEREQKVKADRSQVEASIDRSRMDLTKEEGELTFRCAMYFCLVCEMILVLKCDKLAPDRTMLTDAIRDPTVRLLLFVVPYTEYIVIRPHGTVYFLS